MRTPKNHPPDVSLNEPLVSIILPTYNGKKYLAQSIESCLNQTYTNIELIIVNDASTDDTPNIINKYSKLDPRIRIISNKKNKKLPGSLNVGHAASRGELITWTSDDNYFHPASIHEMAEALKSNLQIGMVYCDFAIINADGRVIRRVSVPASDALFEYNCIGACFLYRKDVYKTIGMYDAAAIYTEDYDYWLRVSAWYSIVPLHKELYFYRFHDGALTSIIKKEKIALAKEFAIMRNLSSLKWLEAEQRFEKAMYFARKASSRRDYLHMLKYMVIALSQSPSQAQSWYKNLIARRFRG